MKIERTFSTKAKTRGSTTKVVASTGNPDRYADIVVWDKDADLENYKNNPVVQFGHNYDLPPVGKTVALEINRNGDLIAEIQWDNSPDNPLGQTVARQFAEGYLSAVSVGFQPGESVPRNRLPKDHPAYGEKGALMSSPRLLEISAVPIPANAEALAIRGLNGITNEIIDVQDDFDSYTVVFRKLKADEEDEDEDMAMEDEDEDMAMEDEDEEDGYGSDDDEDMAMPDEDEEDQYGHDDDDEDDDDKEHEPDHDEDEDEDAPSSMGVEAPDGYHWMDYDGGPVLMAGEDANHDGASSMFNFEVVQEHDPDRLKAAVKSVLLHLLANDPVVRSMIKPRRSQPDRKSKNAMANLFGIDN
ncbi:MAG: hypothetical protein GOVbin1454_30 [Prokaryotic dsDNA virus sp.]|nr:MAG: hypothetical protein GOVbin1454_30 [Prokaryotic dsDNA virus sp.]|tara:strand:- start:648 stop:1718 length:1071 start_codon:yes stop_codon:yes gene_type:complete